MHLRLYREHDEADRPIAGTAALVFVVDDGSAEHERCRRAISAHPRLYTRETGSPGHLPQLCGACAHREGLACRHPAAAANGGPGIEIKLTNGLPAGVICIRPRPAIVRDAVECAGRQVKPE